MHQFQESKHRFLDSFSFLAHKADQEFGQVKLCQRLPFFMVECPVLFQRSEYWSVYLPTVGSENRPPSQVIQLHTTQICTHITQQHEDSIR